MKKKNTSTSGESSVIGNIEKLPSLGNVPEHEGAILMNSEISKSLRRPSSQVSDELIISSLLSNKKFTLTMIKINGNTKTRSEVNTYGFIVVHILSCKANSFIYTLDDKYEFKLSNGCYAHIPPGHYFSFHNLSNESAKASFVILPKKVSEIENEPAFNPHVLNS
ncbi:hypothetical protein FG379_002303 [Cryptosporidium bovis]|uniref:uncharacterized protein n=1 Tax=Cryptosporidium bovis TaxID=310047 RepID=UPI00351A5B7F|nr:hypothetical protein FG379_002303 [Cryptosporidium bovis]